MAKKILLTLFFCITQIVFGSVSASNGPVLQDFKADECTAPAPENFHITSIGGNFISLAWTPAWAGATHTLAVLENDGAGGWISFDTINNVPGSSYTVNGLVSGQEYRFIIATNCPSGEPSSLKAIIDGIALILDLAIDGRNPNTPVAVDCNNIPLNNNWVGFKVEYTSAGTSIANFFEFVVVGGNYVGNNFFSHVQIRRVYEEHPIVAVDQFKIWPTCDDPILPNVGTSFRMARLLGGGPNMELIGWIDVSESSSSSISICANYNHPDLPWKKTYTFTALIAPKAAVLAGCRNASDNSTMAFDDFKVQSPFDETLHVFFPHSFSENSKATFRLLNTQGQIVMGQRIEMITSEIAFPVRSVDPGVYILQIETEGEMHSLKVIKV